MTKTFFLEGNEMAGEHNGSPGHHHRFVQRSGAVGPFVEDHLPDRAAHERSGELVAIERLLIDVPVGLDEPDHRECAEQSLVRIHPLSLRELSRIALDQTSVHVGQVARERKVLDLVLELVPVSGDGAIGDEELGLRAPLIPGDLTAHEELAKLFA